MSTPTISARVKTAPAEAPPLQFDGKKRRLQWTCRHCGHGFVTWTRRGLRVTCPRCGRVQEGPAGIERVLELAGKKEAKKKATPVKVIAVTPPAVTKLSSPPPSRKRPAAPPSPPPTAPPKRGMLATILYGPVDA